MRRLASARGKMTSKAEVRTIPKPRTLTQYFLQMRDDARAIRYDSVTDLRFHTLLQSFEALIQLGLELEQEAKLSIFDITKHGTNIVEVVKKRIAQKQTRLEELTNALFDEIGKAENGRYCLNSQPLLELAEIYHRETQKFVDGDYKFHVMGLGAQATPDEELESISTRLAIVATSICLWKDQLGLLSSTEILGDVGGNSTSQQSTVTSTLDDRETLLDRSQHLEVELTPMRNSHHTPLVSPSLPAAPLVQPSNVPNQHLVFLSFLNTLLLTKSEYHQQRLVAVCRLLKNIQTVQEGLQIVDQQIELGKGNPRGLCARLFHRLQWPHAVESEWSKRNDSDDYGKNLENLRAILSSL